MISFISRFLIYEGQDFGFWIFCLSKFANQGFGCQRSIAKTNLWLKSFFQIDIPFKPLRLFTGQFNSCKRVFARNIARTLHTAFAIYSRQFQHKRVAFGEIVEFSVIMVIAINCCRLHPYGVCATDRGATIRQRIKANMTTAVVTSSEIIVSRI